MQRPVHQEAEALAGAAQQKTQKNSGNSGCYRGQDLTIGASRWGKPSFLTHSEVTTDQVKLGESEGKGESVSKKEPVSLARCQECNKVERGSPWLGLGPQALDPTARPPGN